MRYSTKTLVIIDLEATCWEPKILPTDPRYHDPKFQQEIIEIGIATLDLTQSTPQILYNDSILVRPQYSEVSEFCTKLTGHTPESVKAGKSLDQACRILREDFHSRYTPWASWGEFDQSHFQKECSRKGIDYPWNTRHLNLKLQFSLQYHLPKELGMKDALKHLAIPLAGRHHSGKDDAFNTAKIAQKMYSI